MCVGFFLFFFAFCCYHSPKDPNVMPGRKLRTDFHTSIVVRQDIYRPCLPLSPSLSIALICPSCACLVVPNHYSLNRSTHKKTLFFFHEFPPKCYLSKVYLHFILNLISDCGSKEFNTLLRRFSASLGRQGYVFCEQILLLILRNYILCSCFSRWEVKIAQK